MKSLLIVAHGSRVSEANEFVVKLASQIAKDDSLPFNQVDYAFLEFGNRPPRDRVAEMVKNGVKEVVCFPLFLSTGKHVSTDIPALKREIEIAYPGLTFRVTSHLGAMAGIEQLIIKAATQAF